MIGRALDPLIIAVRIESLLLLRPDAGPGAFLSASSIIAVMCATLDTPESFPESCSMRRFSAAWLETTLSAIRILEGHKE